MNAPFVEKTDVFLPGHGTTLTQAPAYHWEPADAVSGRVYFSTRDPDTLLILLEGLDEEQRQEVIFAAADTAAILGPVFTERTSGSVFVAFWKMPADVLHDLEYFGEYARQGGGFWLLESTDEGRSWSAPSHIRPQPNDEGWVGWPNNCVHGIQLVCGRPEAGPEDLILFSNPLGGSPARGLTVRLSRDAGLTWPCARLLEQGPCRYSDLAVMPDGTILCLYTTGTKRDREKISVARFNLEWLTGQP